MLADLYHDAVTEQERAVRRFLNDVLGASADDLRLVSSWESRTARFYRYRGPNADVLIKAGKSWGPEIASQRSIRMRRIAAALNGDSRGASVPTVLGWQDAPAMICTEFVEARRLSEWLAECSTQAQTTLISECGQTLGLIHTTERPSGPSAEQAALASSRRIMKRLQVRGLPTEELEQRVMPVVEYGDFAPYNFLRSPANELLLIDPPALRGIGSAHRDIAWFLLALGRTLGPEAAAEQLPLLRASFLAGYAETGPIDPTDSLHGWMIDLHATYFHLTKAWKAVKRGRLLRGGRDLQRAAQLRYRLREDPAEHNRQR